MRKSTRRLILIAFAATLLGGATALALRGLRESVIYFYGPAEIAKKAAPGQRVRLGGLVQQGSVRRQGSGEMTFVVTDGVATTPVHFKGRTPDLFAEGKGVVAEGIWEGSLFEADLVLAKHDANYIPKEVADELKKTGRWRGN